MLPIFLLHSPTHVLLVVWLGCVICLGCQGIGQSKPDAQSIDVFDFKDANYNLKVFDNSDSYSQAIAINSGGDVIGVREMSDDQSVYFQEYFYIAGDQQQIVPRLEGYTNIEITALSESGTAVGYASRPMGHPDGSLIAVAWDSSSGDLTNLGRLPGDASSHAQDISADDKRITGYSTGSSPSRMLPCVWDWDSASKTWLPEALPVTHELNPFLLSSRVLISPDGRYVAACITAEIVDSVQYDSCLVVWEEEPAGTWKRRQVSEEQLYLKDINNKGEMAAAYSSLGTRQPCHMGLDGELTLIDLLAGDVSGEACGINEEGQVVGFSNDPGGPEGGPVAFVWAKGVTTPLPMPSGSHFSSAYAINNLGQIAGLVDIILPESAVPERSTAPPEVTPNEKTLAFVWTPVAGTP
jgi:uncharacterized membrane protein